MSISRIANPFVRRGALLVCGPFIFISALFFGLAAEFLSTCGMAVRAFGSAWRGRA